MSLSRVKTWISGEVLTASDLNSEFNNILTNALSLISPLTGALDIDGQTLTLDAAAATQVVSSAAASWDFTSGAKAGTPATTGSVANWSAQTFTDSATAGSGTAASYVAHGIQRPTIAATNASVTTTDAATFYIANAPAAGTNQTITNALAFWVDDGIARFDGAVNMAKGADIASPAGGTLNLTTATGNAVHVTGTNAITAVTLGSGMWRLVIFDGALTLTHHSTNNNLPSGANITTAANDRALYWSDGTTVYCAIYMPAAGYSSLAANTFTGTQTITSTDAGATAGPTLDLYRNSASPAASDNLGYITFSGEDAAGGTHTYGGVYGRIEDTTNGSEDGSVIVQASVAGSLATEVVFGGGVYTPNATGGAKGADSINASALYDDGTQVFPTSLDSAQATTSGTSFTITVPSWAKKVSVMLSGVSTDGTGVLVFQLGDAGGNEPTGYLGAGTTIPNASSPVTANYTTSFGISGDGAAAAIYHGVATFTLMNSSANTWAFASNISRSDTTVVCVGSGVKSTSAAMTTITFTNNGANTFDAGSINALFE